MNDGSAAIIESGERILLQQRDFNKDIPYPGSWSLFGGHLQEGEWSLVTLLRELEEELGINFKPNDFAYLGKFSRIETPTGHIHLYSHTGDYTVNSFSQLEGNAMAFVNPNYLPRLRVTPDMRGIFEQIYKQNG